MSETFEGIPLGMKFVGFRLMQPGEWYLNGDGQVRKHCGTYPSQSCHCVVAFDNVYEQDLQPLIEKYEKDGYKFVGYRSDIKRGQYYLGSINNGLSTIFGESYIFDRPRLIFERTVKQYELTINYTHSGIATIDYETFPTQKSLEDILADKQVWSVILRRVK